jgi:uncharacterized protein (DUF305 family)
MTLVRSDKDSASRNGWAAGTPSRRPAFGTVALAIAVVVGLLLGLGAGLLVPPLTRPGDTSVDAGFARDMSSHHAQAVEMGTLAHAKGTDPEVRQIGIDIALTQQAQIGMMQTWLRDWGLNPTGSQPRMAWMPDGQASLRDGLMPGMVSVAEMDQLRATSGRDFDVLFLKLMRQHHLGGIHMAEAAESSAQDADVRWLAETMVSGQQREITDLQAALKRLGG